MVDFSYTEPVRDPQLFVGRNAIREEFLKSLRSTVLLGEARIGKTSLLVQLHFDAQRFNLGEKPVIPIYIDLGHPGFRCPQDVLRRAASYLVAFIKTTLQVLPPKDSAQIRDVEGLLRLLDFLQLSGVRSTPLFLVDDLDRPRSFSADEHRFDFYSSLRKLLDFSPEDNSAKLVGTAGTGFLYAELPIVSQLISRLQPRLIGNLTREEAFALANRCKSVEAASESETIKSFLFERTGGHPCLIQELLANGMRKQVTGMPLLQALSIAADEIVTNGASFFEPYVAQLGMREVLLLETIALGSTVAATPFPDKSVNRIEAAGLVRTDLEDATVEPSCQLFFEWLRQHLNLLLAAAQFVPVVRDAVALRDLLNDTLRAAIGRSTPANERDVQNAVQAILAARQIAFQREKTIRYKGKQYRIDFALDELGIALEIKIFSPKSKKGVLVDQLEADARAYSARYPRLLVLIYDTTGRLDFSEYSHGTTSPFSEILVVHHTSNHE